MQLAKSFKQTTVLSVLFGAAFVIVGLTASYYAALKPGGAIALTGVAALALTYAVKKVLQAAGRKPAAVSR
jgi:zinc transport system permease protein